MKIGTKSILFGAHCFLIHPWVVALAWWRLYGFPFDPRLWVAFFVHDLGYLGKPNMDGPEGECHPEAGAALMRRLFGRQWGEFTLYHSRYYAKRNGAQFSRLCVADKLAFCLTPRWLYLPMVRATGELHEYLATGRGAAGEAQWDNTGLDTAEAWHARLHEYMGRWVAEHKDCRPETWIRVRHGAQSA